MFKKSKPAKDEPSSPAESPEQSEARRIIERGERLKALGSEAGMWRAFATACADGRRIWEHPMYDYRLPSLNLVMDADSAAMWKEFALRMAQDRESRLRDVLSGC